MASKRALSEKTVDGLLKSMLVLARTVEYILEDRAVETAVDGPLSASKVQVLRLLGRRGGQTSTQVAHFLGVSKPAVSQIIDSMVASKLVARKSVKHDRRQVVLQLAERGKAQFRAVRRTQRQLVRGAFRASGNGEADSLADTLETLTKALVASDRAYEKYCLQCGAHADGSCVLVDGDAECVFLEHKTRRMAAPRKKSAPKRE